MLFVSQAVATKWSSAPGGIYPGAAPGVAQRPHFPVFSPPEVVRWSGGGALRSVPLRKDAIPGTEKMGDSEI